MANNLHISYDLKEPGKNYDRVISAIKSLGSWAKIHYSFWYVQCDLSAAQVRDALIRVIDTNDSVYVVDATNNNAAWHNISSSASDFIRERWQTRTAA
jgi:hypothetical protein